MIEQIIILLVGASCNMLDFYQGEMPGLLVACAGDNSLHSAMATYGVLSAHGWQVVYVVDEKTQLPEFDHPTVEGAMLPIHGAAYISENHAIAWRYVHVILHEAAHLTCGCHHGPMHDSHIQALGSP